MRTFSVGLFFLFFFTSLQAQYILKGYLGIEGGESFHYELHFADSLGYVKGYTYTFNQPKSDVKTSFTGFLDRKNKTLSFQEKEILYNHGFVSRATICLISSTLQFIKEENGQLSFTGAIVSSDLSNTSCSSGSVSISGDDVVKEVFERITGETIKTSEKETGNKIQKPVRSYLYDTTRSYENAQPAKLNSAIEKITEGADKQYEWQSDSLIIELWDGGKIDGDRVTIEINGNKILSNYLLQKEKKKIILPFKNGVSVISIIAENEGNEAPNTANLLLKDGNNEHILLAYNKAQKIAVIKLIHH